MKTLFSRCENFCGYVLCSSSGGLGDEGFLGPASIRNVGYADSESIATSAGIPGHPIVTSHCLGGRDGGGQMVSEALHTMPALL